MVIDFHTHAFPDKIAEKAISSLAACSGGVTPFHNGTVSSLKNYLKINNIDKAVVLNIATNPKQQTNVNNFAISLLNDEMLIPFGSVHPESENWKDELVRLKGAGIKGVKLHPDYQGFFVNDKRMFPIYEKIAELGLITVFHAGVDIGFPEPVHCTPQILSEALPYFNGAPVVAAHFGGFLLWKDVMKYLCGKDLYIDTAFSYGRIPPIYAKQIIEAHSADKILFGSDMPWSGSANELNLVKALGLSEKDMQKVIYGNAERLLNI